MSFWRVRIESGRQTVTLAHGGYLLVFIPLLVTFVVLAGENPAIPILFLLGGLACLFVAKLSLVRAGVVVSFGSSRMTPRFSRLYRVGYGLMGIGVLVSLPAVVGALRALG